MTTMFTLQLGHPKANTSRSLSGPKEYPSVETALQDVFRPQEEAVFLFWNDIPVRMRYLHDVTPSFNDILAMCWFLQKEPSGKTKAAFHAHLVAIEWKLFWDDDNLTIEAHFEARDPLYASYAESLNRNSPLTVSKTAFLREWNSLLLQLKTVFAQLPLTVADGTERRKLELLHQTEQTIAHYGRLYTR